MTTALTFPAFFIEFYFNGQSFYADVTSFLNQQVIIYDVCFYEVPQTAEGISIGLFRGKAESGEFVWRQRATAAPMEWRAAAFLHAIGTAIENATAANLKKRG